MNVREIGVFLAELRKEKCWTQEQLGQKLVLQTRQFPDGKTETTCRQ